MIDPEAREEELYALLGDLCNDSLSPPRLARLEDVLRGDRGAREFYWNYMSLHSELCWRESAAASLAGREQMARRGQQFDLAADPVWTSRPTKSPILGFLSNLSRASSGTPVVTALTWLVMAVLCTGMVLTIFFCIELIIHGVGVKIRVEGAGPEFANHQSASPTSGDTLPAASSTAHASSPKPVPTVDAGAVARLIHTYDSRWAIGSHSPHLGDDLEVGRKLVLMSGLAEVMFQSGVRAVLEGPATMEIGSSRSALLQHGKLTVTIVDPDAHGFAVHTAAMKYTDLGTEFGVWVAKDGQEEVHVFRGTVRAEPGDTAGHKAVIAGNRPALPTERRAEAEDDSALVARPASLIVNADQAIRIPGPGGSIERIKANATQFVRTAQMTEIIAEQSPKYRRWKGFRDALCKRADLLAYYDFQPDPSDDTVLRNCSLSGAKYDGQLVGGAAWSDGRFPGKRALRFHRPGSAVRIDIPVDCEQITLLAWMKLDAIAEDRPRAILASETWTGREGSVHWQVRKMRGGDCSFDLDVSQADRGVVRRSPGRFRVADATGRWGLFAETYDAKTLRSRPYFNADCFAVDSIDKPVAARLGRATIGAYLPQPGSDTNVERTLGGEVDELMVFNSALSAEEIRRLFEE
jgi:hypothetical protein